MANRFGDANENGDDQASQHNHMARRSTRYYQTHHQFQFKEFTLESLTNIRRTRATRSKKQSSAFLDSLKPPLEPDPYLVSGQQLPPAISRQLPKELIGRPIEDIDPFYADQETFVIINRGKELTRFSAKKALYLLGPFHPIRRVVLCILVSSLFNLFVITTILVNCVLMTIQGSDTVEKTEILFTVIYTTEMGLKVLARGFILDQFTYLRDPWNWLDFSVIIMAYLTIVIQDLGNLSVIRTFRVLRALKTVAIIPGMKTIVGAVIDSVKNLKDVVVLTLFSLSVFSLLGLQIYMGMLTQKCVLNGPSNMTDAQWFGWCSNSSHWIPDPDSEIFNSYRLCGNSTGAQSCPPDHTCLQGFGPNPDYGFTNFDTFGWALICSFRLMTQDYWEGLYMQILKTAGSWHIVFFIVSIFLGSIYLMNLILAIVAMSYNELQRRAEEEEEAAAEDEAAFLESCRMFEMSQSTPDVGASYRPSLELGLVGQSLLASLCQNGLLGHQVKKKLDQQIFMGNIGADHGGTNAARSHSLSLNFGPSTAHRCSVASANPWMLGPNPSHNRHSHYDPLNMVVSMTELRRKSRTNGTESPTLAAAAHHQGHHVGQRRILPTIGISGNRLDRRDNLPHYDVRSSYLSPRKDSDCTSDYHGYSYSRRYTSRPSTASDRDLKLLKQKAAMIRINTTPVPCRLIASDSQQLTGIIPLCELNINKGDGIGEKNMMGQSMGESTDGIYLSEQQVDRLTPFTGSADRFLNQPSLSREQSQRASAGDQLRRSVGRVQISARLKSQETHESESIDFDVGQSSMDSADHQKQLTSETAICEQPTGNNPMGRLLASKRSTTTQQQQRRQFSRRRVDSVSSQGRFSPRRRRDSTAASRRSSTMSNVEHYPGSHERRDSRMRCHAYSHQQLSPMHKPHPSSDNSGTSHDEKSSYSAAERLRAGPSSLDRTGSIRSLQLTQGRHSPANLEQSSRAGRFPNKLAVDSDPKTSRMHHLSVENFQQFGIIRSGGTGGGGQQSLDSTNSECSQDASPVSSIGPPVDQRVLMRRHNERGRLSDACALDKRFSVVSRDRLGSKSSCIHPTTMIKARLGERRSFLTNNNPSGQQTAAAGVRRVSKDFVRRASDWGRLSTSHNVDLRRLIKLWSHTNPYQARQSIASGHSYQSQTTRGPNGAESPVQSIKSSQVRYNYSPRASSVSSAWQAYELVSALTRHNNRLKSIEMAQSLASEESGGRDSNYYGNQSIPLDDELIDKMSINMRDKCVAYCFSCLDVLCIWECCGAWLKIQRLISLIVFDPFTDLFIILCILINTLFMALDSDDADEQMRSIFERGNYFFTATFAVEASMKILALSPKFYFREGWNVFDSIIVGLSLLELGLEGVYGLSVLRSFRLLRVFKLAKSWPTLNLLISIMGKAVGDLGNLTFVVAIIVFIFAVMGMQLFGNKYVAQNFPNGEAPRWNFNDFMHSFMIVFRILCAEWIEPMWDCLLVGGWPCIPFFLVAVTVGNLVVLNLFLALLLASFGASNLSSPQADNVDTKKLKEAIERFKRFGRWTRRMIRQLIYRLIFCSTRRRPAQKYCNTTNICDKNYSYGPGPMKSHIVTLSRRERLQNIEKRTEELKGRIKRSPEHHYHLRCLAKSQLKESIRMRNIDGEQKKFSLRYDGRVVASEDKLKQLDPSSSDRHQKVATIPIIVNEPTSETTQDEEENDGSTAKRLDELDERVRDEAQSGAAGEGQYSEAEQEHHQQQQQLSSVSEDVSLNSIESFGNFDCEHYPNCLDEHPRGHATGQAHGHSIRPPMGHGPALSIGMQPISEDTRDDLSLSVAEEQADSNGEDTRTGGGLAEQRNHNRNNIQQVTFPASMKQSNSRPEAAARGVDAQWYSAQPAGNGSIKSTQFDEPKTRASKRPSGKKTNALDAAEGMRSTDEEDGSGARSKSSLYLKPPKREEMEEEDERTLQNIEATIERCICVGIIYLRWFLFRKHVRRVVEHRYFDQCILVLIVISSGTLALEDKHLNERPTLKHILDILDTVFTIIFSLEMVMKWLAFGMRRYFGNIWSWLDFVIVLVSFVNLMASIFGSGKIQALKTMRTLRAMRGLRPLRALQRFQGMRVVVNALIQAIPSIFNVLLVCLIFWLIFSIMGVQMFGGKFWRCLDPATKELVSYEQAANKIECIERNLTWANPQINFDNVLNAYLALFQVATFKGWIDIMNSATDSRTRDEQPIREANIYMYFYFVFFVIVGSFFTLNLFIGVIIDNFNEQKKKTGGSLEIFMTEDQKKYYHAMKKMRSKKPIKAMTRPKFKLQAYMFDITTSKKFDLAIMVIIGLNMFVMALEHYGQSQEFSNLLERLNLIFIAIFTLECLCKVFAMRHYYFREPWNVFDFIVVDLSILGVVMKEYVAKYFFSPTLLRVVRVVKVGRVLRLVKGAKGIRTLLFALAMSLPALFNICLLLFLVMFIYAIFGMSFFMNVRKRAGIDETFNFETFTSSIIVLFEMSTSAGWDLVLDPLMDEENDCQRPDPAAGIEGTCGNKSIAIFYLISYVIVTYLIIINMYIAVILENYSQATEEVQEGLTDDDYEMYYEIWQKFDPNGTQYLPYRHLSDFVDALEEPLRVPKPNDLVLVLLDINIYAGDQCYCVDILDALTKYFFTRKGLVIQVNEHLKKVQSTLHETPFERISTTYLLKRQHYCAKVIQNCWRRWKTKAQSQRATHQMQQQIGHTTDYSKQPTD